MVSPNKFMSVNSGEARMHVGNVIALTAATLLSNRPFLRRPSESDMHAALTDAATLIEKAYNLVEIKG